MPTINKVPYRKVNVNTIGSIGIPSADSNILLIGHRQGVVTGTSPNYPQLQPQAGYAQLTAYRAFALPSFSNGDMALDYMESLGFTVNRGLSSSVTFPAPSSVSAEEPTNKFKKGFDKVTATTATLTWSSVPTNFNLILGANQQISVTQISAGVQVASGNLVSASQSPCQIVLGNVTGTFSSTGQIIVSIINNNLNIPDPARTDEICMMVYRAFNNINVEFPEPVNVITPTVWISYLNPNDTGFSPNSAAISYLNSDGTSCALNSVATLPDGNTALYFSSIPANFGITPLSTLGNTIISNGTASANLVGILPGLTNGGIGLEVNNVSGTFAAKDNITIQLDSSQTPFSLLTTPIQYPCSCYPINTQSDISSSNSKFVPFFNYLSTSNSPMAVNQKAYFAIGIVANINIPKQQASTLPVI